MNIPSPPWYPDKPYKGSGRGRTFFRRSRWPRDALDACTQRVDASDVARPCGLDEDIATMRGYVFVKVRSKTREALDVRRYMRPALLVNAFASEAA